MRTRIFMGLALALTALVTVAVPVLASMYSFAFTVNNSGSASYSNYPVAVTMDNDALVAQGYLASNGLDAKVLDGASELPRLITDTQTLFVGNIPANGTKNMQMTVGNTPAPMSIIPGYGGYVTTPGGSLNLTSGPFSIPVKGLVDTTTPGIIAAQDGAFSLESIGSNQVSFSLETVSDNSCLADLVDFVQSPKIVTDNDSVFETGISGDTTSSTIRKLSKTDLSLQSYNYIRNASNPTFQACLYNLCLDPYGVYVYAVGTVQTASGGHYAGIIVKFLKSDLSLVSYQLYTEPYDALEFMAVVTDGSSLYVAGRSAYDGLIVKIMATSLPTIILQQGLAYCQIEDMVSDGTYLYAAGSDQYYGDVHVGGTWYTDGLMVKLVESNLTLVSAKHFRDTTTGTYVWFEGITVTPDHWLIVTGIDGSQPVILDTYIDLAAVYAAKLMNTPMMDLFWERAAFDDNYVYVGTRNTYFSLTRYTLATHTEDSITEYGSGVYTNVLDSSGLYFADDYRVYKDTGYPALAHGTSQDYSLTIDASSTYSMNSVTITPLATSAPWETTTISAASPCTLSTLGIATGSVLETIGGVGPQATVTVSGVSPTSHTYVATYSGSSITLTVDSSSASAAVAGTPVTNANDIIFMSSVTAYLDYVKLTKNGAEVLRYQPNDIIHPGTLEGLSGGILPDSSGYGNDGLIVWGSNDSNITTTLGAFTVANKSQLVSYTSPSTGGLLGSDAPFPPTMYTEMDTSKVPGGDMIDALLNYGNVPKALWWYPFLFYSLGIMGMLMYGLTQHGGLGSLFFMVAVVEMALIFFGVLGYAVSTDAHAANSLLPLWPAFLFPIPGAACIFSRKHYSYG